jgi:DNA processing protein
MSAPFERALAWATLAQKRLPAPALTALLREVPDPARLLDASRASLHALVPPRALARLRAPVDAQRDARLRAWLADPLHEVIAWDDPDYPRALLALADPPVALFYVGRRDLLNRPALAIVGSRNATPAGRENARAFARTLGDAGLTIVSGLALGIDGAAHEGALDSEGGTLAVIGSGPDRVYPARHRALAHAIAARGGMLSEFPPGTPPLPGNFPRRNRLISGMSRGVLVVEATLSSGSLITARVAGDQGREVFAIPGSIHSPFSRGCHQLIRDGAKLVETARDVLEELHWAASGPTVRPLPDAPVVEGDAAAVLAALAHDPADVDTLVARTALDAGAVATALVTLELAGCASPLPAGRWQRTAPIPGPIEPAARGSD